MPSAAVKSVFVPSVMAVHNGLTQTFAIDHLPFTIGRRQGNSLILADHRVSRDHAAVLEQDGALVFIDKRSSMGSFLNGRSIQQHVLAPGDQIRLGDADGPALIFDCLPLQSSPSELGPSISDQKPELPPPTAFEIEGFADVSLFLSAASKLSSSSVLDEVLSTLIESSLRLTGAERGFVFLMSGEEAMKLAMAKDARGNPLPDDRMISHSIIDDAIRSGSAYLISDTSNDLAASARQSIMAFELRTVICIPLKRRRMASSQQDKRDVEINGVLYLDGRRASNRMSDIGRELLGRLASEAASLLENAQLIAEAEEARRYQQELAIAASIQQQLMNVRLPHIKFAHIDAKTIPCHDIGGDFFDVVQTPDGIAMILADVSGKGISAALLASTLQGVICPQLGIGVPLTDILSAANRFLCEKKVEAKYATLAVAKVSDDGRCEYASCGHVPPLLIHNGSGTSLTNSNLPIGLVSDASYTTEVLHLSPDDRIILVSDGVTEAADLEDTFYGENRLLELILAGASVRDLMNDVGQYCGNSRLADDCTAVVLTYTGL